VKKSITAVVIILLSLPLFFLTAQAEKHQKGQSRSRDILVKSEVETAVSMLQAIYLKSSSGEMSLDQAKKLGADLLRDLGYGKEGYFWADTVDGVNVVLGWKRELEGTNRLDHRDPDGVYYVRRFLSKGIAGGGYVNYLFHRKNEQNWVPKRAYVKLFKPFGWVVGSGYYLDDKDI
jgi:methyl-accepting chemotaxis protein